MNEYNPRLRQCHCGKDLHPMHFSGDKDLEDIYEQHKVRCCGCVDAYLFGAPDCDECSAEGVKREAH